MGKRKQHAALAVVWPVGQVARFDSAAAAGTFNFNVRLQNQSAGRTVGEASGRKGEEKSGKSLESHWILEGSSECPKDEEVCATDFILFMYCCVTKWRVPPIGPIRAQGLKQS